MAPWSFQLVRYNLFRPHILRGRQPQNPWCQMKIAQNANAKASQRWWTWSSPSLRRNEQDTGPGRSSCNKWHRASVDRVWPRASAGHVDNSLRLRVLTSLLSLPLRHVGKKAKSSFLGACWFRRTAKLRWLWWAHCMGWNEFPCGLLPCCC